MKIQIEGFRFCPHSYSLVAMWHALGLQDAGCDVGWADARAHDPKMRQKRGLLSPEDEARIAALPCHAEPDVVFRHTLPIDPRPMDVANVFVFATADYGWLPRRMILAGKPLSELAEPLAHFVTPSEFSRRGLIRSGAQRVAVIPHGVDQAFLNGLGGRQRIVGGTAVGILRGTQGHEPVILNVSDMSRRKGLDVLLRAFAGLLRHWPARLLLKGLGDFSRRHYEAAFRALPPQDRALIAPRVRYIGEELRIDQMAALYHSADLYVSPYRAEAFNLPVTEALACGLPVACTAGGPTDEFASGARFIQSRVITRGIDVEETLLEPDPDDTLAAMLELLSRRPEHQPQIDRQRTWAQVGEQLAGLFLCYIGIPPARRGPRYGHAPRDLTHQPVVVGRVPVSIASTERACRRAFVTFFSKSSTFGTEPVRRGRI